MDITILAAVILAGIALESLLSERAQKRVGVEGTLPDRVARYAGLDIRQEGRDGD